MAETNMEKERGTGPQVILALIRQSSEAGQLLPESEILRRLADRRLFPPPAGDPAEETGKILQEAVEGAEDTHVLAAPDGSRFYYSSRFMTGAYARILLQKKGDRLRLIAAVVRENSALYPRPVSLELFTRPPFELTPQEVLNDLKRMENEEAYGDIASTTTSASRLFLYSTLHLEPDHASMLAEWLDVGQFDNP